MMDGYVPTWAIAVAGGLGILGAVVSKTDQGRLLSLVTGIGVSGVGLGYNALKKRAEIDAIVSAGGVYGQDQIG